MGGGAHVAAVNVPDCRLSIEGVERDLGLTAETIALALGVDRRTIDSWRANQSVPQGKPRARLAELLALHDRLLAILGSPTAAQQWLRARSLYLGGVTPEETLRTGRLDRVRADLDGLAAGVYL
jgi:hypothetical protein